jgi:hypothetical protein
MSEERRKMIAEMINSPDEPVAWIGYFEGKKASVLFSKEDADRFLENTDPCGKVIPLYTKP